MDRQTDRKTLKGKTVYPFGAEIKLKKIEQAYALDMKLSKPPNLGMVFQIVQNIILYILQHFGFYYDYL